MNTHPKINKSYGLIELMLILIRITSVAYAGEFDIPLTNHADLEKDHISRLISDADHVVEAGPNDTYRIGIGNKNKEGAFIPSSHKWKELEHFYKIQKHKHLVVVKIDPGSDWYAKNKKKEIEKFRKNFTFAGFSRVIVVRCLSQRNILDFDSEIKIGSKD